MQTRFIYTLILVTAFILAGSTSNRTDGQTRQDSTARQQTIRYTCTMHPEVIKSHPGKCPKCGMPLVEKKEKPQIAKMYTCRVHPEVVINEPGKCPKCGLPMIEKTDADKGILMNKHSMMQDSTPRRKDSISVKK